MGTSKLNKRDKIKLLLELSRSNDGKILTAKDFYVQLLECMPDESEWFSGTIEIGKLLEQTNIKFIKQSTSPKFYLCSSEDSNF